MHVQDAQGEARGRGACEEEEGVTARGVTRTVPPLTKARWIKPRSPMPKGGKVVCAPPLTNR